MQSNSIFNKRIFSLMRNKICFSLLFLFSFQLSSVFSQDSKVSLLQALTFIKESHNVNLAYDGEAIEGIEVRNPISKDLKTALEEMLNGTNLDYQIFQDNQILIREKQEVANADQRFTKELVRLRGRVIDAHSKEPLSFALIVAGQNGAGTESDINGDFVLLLQKEEKALLIRYLGYDHKQMQVSNNSQDLLIELEPNPVSLGSVLIQEQSAPFRNPVRSSTLKVNHQNTTTSVFGDAIREIALLPGINIQGDLASEISIRGGETDENMIFFDGIPLYNISHFFGVFSNINSNVVEETTIYKNAFPSEFGGRTSGIIDMQSRRLEGDKINAGAEINLLTANAYAEIPLDKKVHLLIGGRTNVKNLSNAELFNFVEENTLTGNRPRLRRRSDVQSSQSFDFKDINLKLMAAFNPKTNLRIASFLGDDRFDYDYNLKFTDENQIGVLELEESFIEDQQWTNKGLSFLLNHRWNDIWKGEFSLSFAGNEQNRYISSNLTRRFRIDRPDKVNTLSNIAENEMNGTHFKFIGTRSLEKDILSLGYEYTANNTKIFISVDDFRPLDINLEGIQHSLFSTYELPVSERLLLSLGLRGTYYSLNENIYLSPRLNLNYKLTNELYLKSALSRYYQFTQMINYEDRLGRSFDLWIVNNGKNYPIQKSDHLMIGFRWLNNIFDLDVEAYRKNTFGFLQFTSRQAGFNMDGVPLVNTEYFPFEGQNITQGIDFTIKKSFKNYSGWIAYTLSESKNAISSVNRGNPFPSSLDQRHQFKLINQITIKDFEIGANYIYSSGRPFLDLSKFKNGPIDRSADLSEFFTYLKSYQRVDLSMAYLFKIGKSQAKIGFSVFNLLDRENIKYKQFIYNTSEEFQSDENNTILGNELKLLGRTWNLNFKIDF